MSGCGWVWEGCSQRQRRRRRRQDGTRSCGSGCCVNSPAPSVHPACTPWRAPVQRHQDGVGGPLRRVEPAQLRVLRRDGVCHPGWGGEGSRGKGRGGQKTETEDRTGNGLELGAHMVRRSSWRLTAGGAWSQKASCVVRCARSHTPARACMHACVRMQKSPCALRPPLAHSSL